MAVTQADLTALYLAYFGRPPDHSGLQHYLNDPNATIQSVAANFSASPESQALYGETFGAAQVNAIYQNLFGRDAELDGINYWTAQVAQGKFTPAFAAYAILLGAQNADKTAVANKLAISAEFLAELDTAAEVIGYAGDDAAAVARAFLRTVGSSADSLTEARANLETAVAETVAAGGGGVVIGETITLTSAIQDSVGTAKADTFKAVIEYTTDDEGTTTLKSSALNLGDTIDGKEGFDTLELLVSGGEDFEGGNGYPVDMVNVEKVSIRAVNTGIALDASNWEGVQEINLTRNTGYAQVVNLQAGVTASLTDIEATGALGPYAAQLGIGYAAGVVDEDFVQKVVVDGVGSADTGFGVVVAAGEDAPVVNWDIDAKGDSALAIGSTFGGEDSTVESLVVRGSGSLTVLDLSDFEGSAYGFSNLKTLDASANSGGVELFIGGDDEGALALESVKGSSGDDRIEIEGIVATGATIDLGAGDDVLVASEGSLANVASVSGGEGTDAVSLDALAVKNADKFSNFEIADLARTSGTIDLALFKNNTFQSLLVTDGLDGDVTLQNLAGTAINLNVESSTGYGITALLKTATGTADSATITYDADSTGSTVTKFASSGLETVNIVSNGDEEDNEGGWNYLNTLAVSSNTLTTVTITGDYNFQLGGVSTNSAATAASATNTASTLTLIDGSAATGDLEITAGASATVGNVKTTYTGLTIKTGSGDDEVSNNAASGVTELGAGEDIAYVGATGQTVRVGADEDEDTVVFTTAAGVADVDLDGEGSGTVFGPAAFTASSKVTTVDQYGEDDLLDLTAFTADAEATDFTTGAEAYNSLVDTINAILNDGNDGLTAFEFADGNTYVVAEGTGTGGEFAGYTVVRIVGDVAVEDLNFVAFVD